jgi:hypothetical protein
VYPAPHVDFGFLSLKERPTVPNALLPRGVYLAPYKFQSQYVLLAIDYDHNVIEWTLLTDESDRFEALANLWQKLDSADPEHSRREVVRAGGSAHCAGWIVPALVDLASRAAG